MDRIKLGQVTAPVGIKGEIRVYPYLEQTRFSDIKRMCVEGLPPAEVQKLRADKAMLVIKLSGIDDRNTAETLRGKILYLPEGDDLDLGEDTYYVDELVGMTVIEENGSSVGTLKSVITRPAQDLYEIEAGGKSFLLPAVKEFILKVDIQSRKITVHLPEGITEL